MADSTGQERRPVNVKEYKRPRKGRTEDPSTRVAQGDPIYESGSRPGLVYGDLPVALPHRFRKGSFVE